MTFHLQVPKGRSEYGLTLIELIISLALIAVISTVLVVRLVPSKQNTSLDATVDTLVADIKTQQLKAMTGDMEGTATTSAYGIFFQTNQYTFFKGPLYTATDSSNFPVSLDNGVSITSISVPANTLLFSKGSGEVSGFVSGSDSIVLGDGSTKRQKTIKFNIYGTIVSIQ